MTREQVTLKVSGLWTYEDVFSAVPEGSMAVAKNVVIDQRNLVSPRRGYQSEPLFTNDAPAAIPMANRESIFSFHGRIHYHTSSGDLFYRENDGVWLQYLDQFIKPTGTNRSRHVAANKNIYVTSQNGVQKIATLGESIVDAGARPGYAPEATVSTAAGTLFDAANQGVAYRILWGYKDANNNLILGAPSSRTVLLNGATLNKDGQLTFAIPSNVTESWFYQIYRTKVQTSITSISQVNDEMFLAYEGNPTNQQITDLYVGLGTGPNPFYIDSQPDELLGLPLYTNATEEGILNSNNEPPQCRDLALYQGYTFYANTTQKAAQTIQLLGTGTDGLQINDRITINGIVFKAVAVPNNTGKTGTALNPYEFLVETTTGSPSADVEITAKDLIAKVTKYVADLDAYYLSEVSGDSFQLPGQIRLVEKDYNLAPTFAISATSANPVADVWTPNLGGVGQAAVAETNPNRLFYSKNGKPEAVPPTNFFDVGAANVNILRIHPLRTSMLIFTETEIYKLSGTTDSAFQVNLLDNTTRLIAPDSTAVLNNSVIGLFDQGVCQVSETVTVLSRPIEGDLLSIRGQTGTNLSALAFGLGYESDRKYILYLPFTAGDTDQAKAAYVYNTVTSTWTLWDKEQVHGVVHREEDKLYMLRDASVSSERKNFNDLDIADEQVPVTPGAIYKGTFATQAALQVEYPDGASGAEITRRTGFFAYLEDTNTNWDWDVGANEWVDSGVLGAMFDSANVLYADISTLGTIAVGDIYFEDETKFSKITEVSTDNLYFVLQDNLDWSAGTWEAQKLIPTEIQFNPIYMSNPAMLKQFSECTLITTSSLENLVMGFRGVTSSSFDDVTFAGSSVGNWGLFPWGDVPWGGEAAVLRYRTLIPREKQKDSAISIRILQDTIFNNFEISGLSIIYRVIGPRVVR